MFLPRTALVPFVLSLPAFLCAPVARGGEASQPGPELVDVRGMQLHPVLQRARDAGHASSDQVLCVAVSLPYAEPEAAQAFADAVSDPRSPRYRQFITPEIVGERFGLPADRPAAIASYLRTAGFEVTLVAPNRLTVVANGTVAMAERAFGVEMHVYELTPVDEVEPASFVANATPVRFPAELARDVIDVCGLETYTRPQRRATTLLTPTLTRGVYDTAGMFGAGGTGAGRVIGVSNFDGFRSAAWINYINHFALPVPAAGAGTNIVVVPCSGGGAGAATPQGEGDLDIQMELGMAPLATIRVYDSPLSYNLISVLAQEVSDNQCDAISESYGWNLSSSTITSAHNNHVSMTAQGISYLAASGDTGTSFGSYPYPDFEPEALQVGGTIATVNTPSGSRVSEVGWSGSGGGWSTNSASFNVRPAWQTGNGVPAINGSNNRRLVPDVAFHAAGSGTGAYPFYVNNTLDSGSYGTSFSSPMFCGSLALIQQKMIALGGLSPDAQGKRRLGRMQDYIYAQNGRSDIWHDITSGTNGNLPGGQGVSSAHAGWDTVTGWGPMDCEAFANVAACDTGAFCGGSTPGTQLCFGDGSGTACPCGNIGLPGGGCNNTAGSGGAILNSSGVASVAQDTLVLSVVGAIPSGPGLFFQGSSSASPGTPFGNGLLCLGGTTARLEIRMADATGAASTVQPVNVLGGNAAGSQRYYQFWYRDAPNYGACSAGYNLSSAVSLTWIP